MDLDKVEVRSLFWSWRGVKGEAREWREATWLSVTSQWHITHQSPTLWMGVILSNLSAGWLPPPSPPPYLAGSLHFHQFELCMTVIFGYHLFSWSICTNNSRAMDFYGGVKISGFLWQWNSCIWSRRNINVLFDSYSKEIIIFFIRKHEKELIKTMWITV